MFSNQKGELSAHFYQFPGGDTGYCEGAK